MRCQYVVEPHLAGFAVYHQVALSYDEEESEGEHNEAVSRITEHDGKQERERDDGERSCQQQSVNNKVSTTGCQQRGVNNRASTTGCQQHACSQHQNN